MGKTKRLPDVRYLQRKDLLERWGICHMTLERRLLDPDFPNHIRFTPGPRGVRFWRLDEIEAYERKKAGRAA